MFFTVVKFPLQTMVTPEFVVWGVRLSCPVGYKWCMASLNIDTMFQIQVLMSFSNCILVYCLHACYLSRTVETLATIIPVKWHARATGVC